MTNNTSNKNKKMALSGKLLCAIMNTALINTTFLCAAPPKEQQHNQQLSQFTEGTTEGNIHYPQANNSTVQQNNAQQNQNAQPVMMPSITVSSAILPISGPLVMNTLIEFAHPAILQSQAQQIISRANNVISLKAVLQEFLHTRIFNYMISLITPDKIASLTGEERKDTEVRDFIRSVLSLDPNAPHTEHNPNPLIQKGLPTNLDALQNLYFALNPEFYYAIRPKLVTVPELSATQRKELYYGWHDCLLNDAAEQWKTHSQTLDGLRMLMNKSFRNPVFPYIAQKITLEHARRLSNDDTVSDLVQFVKSQLSSENQQVFERILNETKQVVRITSQNPLILRGFLKENMIRPTIFYATVIQLEPEIIQSMKKEQALDTIWFDQLYELTNADVRNALTSYWQKSFIDGMGIIHERERIVIDKTLVTEIVTIFENKKIYSRWLCTLWLDQFGKTHKFVEFKNWLNKPENIQIKNQLREVLVPNFPTTDSARGKLAELFDDKKIHRSNACSQQNASTQATTNTAADSSNTPSISNNALSIADKLLLLSRQENDTEFKAECSKLRSSDLKGVWNLDLIKAMKPHCNPEVQTELEKIIQSAEIKMIDASDTGRAQLWNYIVSKYNQNQFFVKDMLTQDNLQQIYNLHMLRIKNVFENLMQGRGISGQEELNQQAAHSRILDSIFTTAQQSVSEKLQELFYNQFSSLSRNEFFFIATCLIRSQCILSLYLNHVRDPEIISIASVVINIPLVKAIISISSNLINSRFTEKSEENLNQLKARINSSTNQ